MIPQALSRSGRSKDEKKMYERPELEAREGFGVTVIKDMYANI